MDYEREIKKCIFEKDIFSLQSAEMELRRKVLESKKVIFDAETRANEYRDAYKQKQAELAQFLEG